MDSEEAAQDPESTTGPSSAMDLHEELLDLTARHAELIDGFPWAFERSRWEELVFCLLNAFSDDAAGARAVVAALDGAGVLTPAALAEAGRDADERGVVVRHVLLHHGFDDALTAAVASILAQVAAAVQERYSGRLQRLLRAHAEVMREELLGMVPDPEEYGVELTRAFSHWLQNAADLPICLVDGPVQSFLGAREITVAELEAAADTVDVNIALIDDVLRAELEERLAGEEA
jgi:hypothetical protein